MIKSTAPTRIDLAGGTLDIWPLYLLLDMPPTVNAAVNLYAAVEVEPRADKAIHIESRDLRRKARFSSIDALPEKKHPLELILRALRFYRPRTGVNIVTDCQAPAGSGIGGSSSLAIALNGALNRLTGAGYKPAQLLDIAKNIETRVINTATGWQDYFPALYGGVQSIQPAMTGIAAQKIKLDLESLAARFVLCYTGKPHHSGINNWQVMKRFLNGEKAVARKLARIGAVARAMAADLRQGNVERLAHWLDEEWKARRALAPGISTPAMDRMIGAARKRGALAAKVCGAGGGGCVAFFVRERAQAAVSAELEKQGARVLPFQFTSRGLHVAG